MRVFANLFLILFLADGGISVLDELFSLFSVGGLSGVRNLIAFAVIFISVPFYLSLGIDKRLPKRVFLPLILFVFWCPLFLWFFPSLSGSRTYGFLIAFGQVLLTIPSIVQLRKMGGRNLLMPKAMFRSPFFSMRNTLLFVAANIFIIPITLALVVLSTADSYIEKQTAGFMRIAPNGIYMTERIYRRDNKTIRLVSMIHVGEKEYYDGLAGSVSSGRTIVLAEGITDEKNLLQNRLGYGKVAGFLGLTSQEKMQFSGRVIEAEEIAETGFKGGKAETTDILRADVDTKTFHPSTIRVLNVLGKHMNDSASFLEAMRTFNAWAEKNITPEVNKILMDDILYRRNKEVIRHLGKALCGYDTIVIPWGALHMTEIEESVLRRGFVLREERKRVGIDFRKLLMDTGDCRAGTGSGGGVISFGKTHGCAFVIDTGPEFAAVR